MGSDGYLSNFSYMISHALTPALPTPLSFSRLWIPAPQRHRLSYIHANRVPRFAPQDVPGNPLCQHAASVRDFVMPTLRYVLWLGRRIHTCKFRANCLCNPPASISISNSVTSDRFQPCSPTTKAGFLQQAELSSSFTDCMRRSEVR